MARRVKSEKRVIRIRRVLTHDHGEAARDFLPSSAEARTGDGRDMLLVRIEDMEASRCRESQTTSLERRSRRAMRRIVAPATRLVCVHAKEKQILSNGSSKDTDTEPVLALSLRVGRFSVGLRVELHF